MRDLHTLKGICALFGVNGIAGRCHTLEDRIRETGALPDEQERLGLRRQWRALQSGLKPFTGSERSSIELSEREYHAFQQLLDAQVPHPELVELVRRWVDGPVLPRLDRLAEYATKLAGRLGKCKLAVDFGGTTSACRTSRGTGCGRASAMSCATPSTTASRPSASARRRQARAGPAHPDQAS